MRGLAGFSLVELLVSISIVTLMLGVGVPAFRAYGRQSAFDQAATDIQVAVLQAHNLAFAPETNKPSMDNYYGLSVNAVTGTYDVVRNCWPTSLPNSCPNPRQPDVIIERHQLEAGIIFSSQPSPVGYLVGMGGEPVVSAPPANAISIRSNQLSGASDKVITVNPVTGQVTVR